MPSSAEIVEEILRREGSAYTNHPADKGGPTKWGVTQDTLSKYRGHAVSETDVSTLSRDEAVEIYLAAYVRPFALFPDMQPRLLGLLADAAVNHGPSRAIRWLQEAIGAGADGVIGKQTLEKWIPYAKHLTSHDDVYKMVLARRIVFYGEIVSGNPSQSVFIKGWLKRAVEFL